MHRLTMRKIAKTLKPQQLEGLIFIGNIGGNVAGLTIEDLTEYFQRVGADAFIALQAGDLSGADMETGDQGVLGDPLLLQFFP